jgi:tetratricopeptide (TPR) repeat protein
MALLAGNRLRDAETAFETALELDTRSAQAHCGLGLTYQRQHRWDEAALAFETTEALAPTHAAGPLNLGLALDALGDIEGARRALLRAAAISPEDREIRDALARLVAATPAPNSPAPVQRDPDSSFAGDLQTFALGDVLELLRQHAKSGTLVLSSTGREGLVHLVNGELTGATVSSLQGLRAPPATSRPPTREAARARLMGALGQMLTWTEGTFAFHHHEPVGEPAYTFDVQHVLLELMRAADERRRATDPRRG